MSSERKVDVLLVDDNQNNLLALESVLADLSVNLVKANSGAAALRCLLRQDFALILLDVQMPIMDGFDTANLIRQRERSRYIPIIFLTAFHRSDTQVFKGYSVGAVDFLFKPIVPEMLKSKVLVFVDLYRKTEEVKRQAEMLRESKQREHERELIEAKQHWEADQLRAEMEKEKRIGETISRKADELARTIAERERAQEELRESNDRLKLLSETANRLLTDIRPEESLSSLLEQISAHLGLEIYLSYQVHENGRSLRLGLHGGIPSEIVHMNEPIAFGQGLWGEVARSRRDAVLEDIQHSTNPQVQGARALGASALACFPLLAQDRLMGVLSFGTSHRARFQADELATLRIVCNQVAMTMERARLISELHHRAAELAEADRRKDEFLAMLAHELRNPLAPIRNAVELLRVPEDGDPVHQRAWGAMDRQVRHLVRLVDDLLDVSRINSGNIELCRVPVDLATLVEHAVELSLPLIEARKHHITVKLPPEPVRLHGDPIRLAQVMANLLNNAAKYMEPGGHIWVTAAQDGAEALLTVRDTGIGIREDLLPRIFDLFVQADRSADRALGGLGIGLTLVRRLVQLHEGTIEARSEGLGKGSEFIVRLPLLRALSLEPQEGPEIRDGEPGQRALRIVIVDDNDDIRQTLRDLLEAQGHTVSEAQDGHAGIKLVLEIGPEVALVDIGLPGLDGYEVVRRLRAKMPPGEKRTRLIALTGYGQADDRRRALEAGFDAHLVKPVDLQELFRTLTTT